MKITQRRKSHRLREKSVTKEVHNNWEISYGDMITLLLGFFVLFFNIKSDRVNMQLLMENLEKKFNKAEGTSSVTGVQQRKETATNLIASPSLQKYKLHSNIVGEKLFIEFPGVSFFNPGRVDLTVEGKKSLDQFAQAIGKNIGSVRLVIRGYTDNTPTPSTPKYKDNLELSAWRSISAIRHLNSRGVELKFMRIGGYGETDLSDRRLPAEQRRLDRKVVIVIEPLDAAERNHESLNKVADTAKEGKKPETKIVKPAPTSIEKLIAADSFATWFAAEYGDLSPIAARAPKTESTAEKPVEPPATTAAHDEKSSLPKRHPASAKDAEDYLRSINSWIEGTYLYKKINPYYTNDSKTQPRGQE